MSAFEITKDKEHRFLLDNCFPEHLSGAKHEYNIFENFLLYNCLANI